MEELDVLVDLVMKEGASDLHISEGNNPYIRIAGQLVPLTKYPKFTRTIIENILSKVLTPAKQEAFKSQQSADFAYAHKGERFRSHAFVDQQRICLAFRYISNKIPTLTELNLPEGLENFARLKSGFFLVVGPTGHGKSTTLASLVELINTERLENIITIEDPIEYVFTPKKSIIHQREIGQDTPSFASALHDSFRADVNVIMVGEMRDPESISIALTAAETGHLVFSTLHTNSISQTIDRIVDSFPGAQQGQIRSQLSTTLIGIVSERLIPRIAGGRIPACEIMFVNSAIKNLIREKKTYQIDLVIDTSVQEGMTSLNRSLVELVRKREISLESAEAYSLNASELRQLLG